MDKKVDLFKKYQIRKNIINNNSSNDNIIFNASSNNKSKWIKIILFTIVFFTIVFSSVVGYYVFSLPSPLDIEKRVEIESTKIFDREGNLLYEIHNEGKRTLLNYNEIPKNIINATIAVEDDKFFEHQGVDIIAFFYALTRYLFLGDKSRGGSTITQQLVKNTLLSSEKTIDRKFKEIILSIMTERMYTKEKILEMYLNKIPYGNNAYGIFAASKTYFNKAPADLTIAESAFLASIPQKPTYYNPYGPNLDDLIRRKNYVINRMYDLGMINEEQKYMALKEEIKIHPYKDLIKSPHFVMYVKDLLVKKYGEEILKTKGLKVYTTLDPMLQKEAENAITEGIKKYGPKYNASNGALVAANPKTGEILAMVGSKDYFATDIDGQVNVSLAKRQPGSSIKPLAYLAGFIKGYTPATVFWDVPMDFGGGYKPQNYDRKFRGPVTARNALAQSLNIPAVQMLYLAGVQNVLNLGKELGLTFDRDASFYGLSFVLGGGEVRLIDMVQMYSVFANQGMKNDLTPILKIVDNNGNVIDSIQAPKNTELIDKGFIFLLTSILSDNTARAPIFGLRNSMTLPDRPVAAKTGTTNEYKDAWIIGYTPSLVAGVWVGNNDNTPMKEASSYLVAGPIWQKFMINATKNTPVEKFEKPNNVITKEVSTLTGKLPSQFTPKDKIRLEYFVKGMEPKEVDDYLIFKKVEKITGKLATDSCPKEVIEYWVYENAHSLKPELPNWEIPVKNFVQNYHPVTSIENVEYEVKFVSYDQLPTTYNTWCDDPKYSQKTTFAFITPQNGDKILKTDKLKISFAVGDESVVKEIRVYINDMWQATLYNGQLSTEILLPNLEVGHIYKIKGELHSKYFYTLTDTVSVSVVNDLSPINFDIISPVQDANIVFGNDMLLNIKIDDVNDFNRIDFYLNGKYKNTFNELVDGNVKVNINTTGWPIGKNKITLMAYDKSGNQSEQIIYINIIE